MRSDDEFELALNSQVDTIFFLSPNILELKYTVQKAHQCSKKLFIHLDLTSGLGKDKLGIEFSKICNVDGIISTRTNLIRIAKELGMATVQRFFIVDSHSINTTIESLKSSGADMIEIMPGVSAKIIERLRCLTEVPIIAGGLIDTEKEVITAIKSGAKAISTGEIKLWNLS